MGALAATWKDTYKKPFEPLAGDVEFVPYGDGEELADAVDDETAAVILEPIQGEGGINVPPTGYLETARELTDEAGAALVLDEVQTGMGRTGSMWACENAGVTPDILTTAKGWVTASPSGGCGTGLDRRRRGLAQRHVQRRPRRHRGRPRDHLDARRGGRSRQRRRDRRVPHDGTRGCTRRRDPRGPR